MKWGMKTMAAIGLLAMSSVAFAQDPDYDGAGSNIDYAATGKTAADDTVTNTAYVKYTVGTVDQEEEINDPVAQFKVDRVILIHVAAVDSPTDATPGGQGVMEFLVRNDTNDDIDILLTFAELGGDDFDFDPTDNVPQVYLESGAVSNGFQAPGPGGDILLGNLDDLDLFLDNVGAEQQKTVYVVGDIPSSATVGNGDEANISVLITAYELDGSEPFEETNESIANEVDPMYVDTVFGDLAGPHANDGPDPDGKHSAIGTFTIASATISVFKTSFVLSDPFNGTDSPKAIPGAEVIYCITVENESATQATNVSVRDPIPTGTSYKGGTIRVATSAVTCNAAAALAGDEVSDTDADSDGGHYDSTEDEVHTNVAALDEDDVAVTIFHVTID